MHSLNLEKIRECGTKKTDELIRYADDPDENKRWAATMSLGAIAHKSGARDDILVALKRRLDDKDESIRATAAELLLSVNDNAGIEVLIDLLESKKQLHPSEPPAMISVNSLQVLKEYTKQKKQTKKEWQEWWTSQNEK